MLNAANKLSAHELVHDLLPKLKATEDLVNNTLSELISQAESEEDRTYRKNQKIEFELEISMIHMNLDHLLKRYSDEIKETLGASENAADVMLHLDQHERFAIESAKKLYERARDIQRT